jgi:hypothetical protein
MYIARLMNYPLCSQWLKTRLNEKCDILEKSCRHKIFMISNFNGGHRNGKNVVLLAVYAVSAWRFFGPFQHFLVTIDKSWNPSGNRVGQKWKSLSFPISMWVAVVTKSRRSNILLMYLAQNDLLVWLATAKIALDQDSRHPKKKLLRQHLHNFQF